MSAPEPRLPFAEQVCLSMIVRNEAAVIRRCLQSVRPLIGAWAVVDTGSTDGTQALVREALADLPGMLLERPWQDFAHNRNQALDLARQYGDYALIVDADDVLELDAGAAWPQRLDGPGHYLLQRIAGSDIEYRSPKLLAHAVPWRWHGVLHEYPAADPPPLLSLLAGARVTSHPDGARSQRPLREKYLDDAAVLAAELTREPANTRTAFYLAQSLRDAGEDAPALEAYRRRAAMGGWPEEVFYAQLQVGALLERLRAPLAEILDACLLAHDARPTRAEPLIAAARLLRAAQRYASAYLFAARAAALPLPDDLLFVDRSVHLWGARDEQALSAWYLGRIAEAESLWRALLASPDLPASEHARIRANLDWCATAGGAAPGR